MIIKSNFLLTENVKSEKAFGGEFWIVKFQSENCHKNVFHSSNPLARLFLTPKLNQFAIKLFQLPSSYHFCIIYPIFHLFRLLETRERKIWRKLSVKLNQKLSFRGAIQSCFSFTIVSRQRRWRQRWERIKTRSELNCHWIEEKREQESVWSLLLIDTFSFSRSPPLLQWQWINESIGSGTSRINE